jgi:uncharacterized protein (DUF342 family)
MTMNDLPASIEKKKKFLEPKFHFLTKNVIIGEDESAPPVTVAELMLAGQVLASFPNFAVLAAKGYEKAGLVAGDYVDFAEDGETIIARVAGYPRIMKVHDKERGGIVTQISIEPVLQVSVDKMHVNLVIHPPIEGGNSLQQTAIEKILANHNICYGINEEALAKAKAIVADGEQEFNRIGIASGRPAGKSQDAYLQFAMEVGPIAGTIAEDGSIDFRERKIMVAVAKNQLIATKIPARQGDPGIDVYGEETPTREGKDITVNLSNDVTYSRETREVRATRDGVLSIVNNSIIKVCSHQIISRDIDFETGNIDSMNAVTVQGSVHPGFRVRTAGDMKVTGNVMSSHLICAGNLVISGGVTGKNNLLEVTGDADINFIEQGELTAGGIIVIRKQSYYSKIRSGADIRCKPGSMVVGGFMLAAGSITVTDVGAEDSTPCLLAAGVVPERIKALQDMKQRVIDQQEEIIQWVQKYPGSNRSKKVRDMEKNLAETKVQLLRLNLIPGTGIYSRGSAAEPGNMIVGEEYSSAGGIDIQAIRIDVSGTLMANSEIRIGNSSLRLDKTVSNRQFRLHPNGKRIIAGTIKAEKQR